MELHRTIQGVQVVYIRHYEAYQKALQFLIYDHLIHKFKEFDHKLDHNCKDKKFKEYLLEISLV
jgi:hypothetical protein